MTSRAFEGPEYMAERGRFAGPSLLEMMEHELARIDKIIALDAATSFDHGRRRGMQDAISIIRQPYAWLADHPQTRIKDAQV